MASMSKNRYEVITLPLIVPLLQNLTSRCKMTGRWRYTRQSETGNKMPIWRPSVSKTGSSFIGALDWAVANGTISKTRRHRSVLCGQTLKRTMAIVVDWKFSEPRNGLSYEVFLLICTHMASTSKFSLVARLATLGNSGNLHKSKMAATYFGTPSISQEWLKLETWNLVCG